MIPKRLRWRSVLRTMGFEAQVDMNDQNNGESAAKMFFSSSSRILRSQKACRCVVDGGRHGQGENMRVVCPTRLGRPERQTVSCRPQLTWFVLPGPSQKM